MEHLTYLKDGLLAIEKDDKNKQMKLYYEGDKHHIVISKDNWKTWTKVADATGIIASNIKAENCWTS